MPKGIPKNGINKGRFVKGIPHPKGRGFKKGYTPWNKGKKLSKEIGEKMGKSRSGSKHWNWKGGITEIKDRIRNCFKSRMWRSDVFHRDNFTCQICNIKSGNGKTVVLNADHYPKSFSKIIIENKINTIEKAESCEELWDLNNGRTLCLECHKKTDTYRHINIWKTK